MWKIFVIPAAVGLIAAGVVGYQNKLEYEGEIKNLLAEGARRDQAIGRIASTKEELKKSEDELAVVQQKTVELTAQVRTNDLAVSEQEKAESKLSEDLDKIVGSIIAVQEIIVGIGPIEEVGKEMARLEAEEKAASEEVTVAQNRLAGLEQQNRNLQSRIESYVELEREQLGGEMTPGLRASVTIANHQWGFVVLNKGQRHGLVARGDMIVARDGFQICKLVVTTLEPNSAVASIVKDSLPAGYYVVPGDVVIAVPKDEVVASNDG